MCKQELSNLEKYNKQVITEIKNFCADEDFEKNAFLSEQDVQKILGENENKFVFD